MYKPCKLPVMQKRYWNTIMSLFITNKPNPHVVPNKIIKPTTILKRSFIDKVEKEFFRVFFKENMMAISDSMLKMSTTAIGANLKKQNGVPRTKQLK